LDEKGDLYIFELKVWESRSENILQVLRYGQIFGTYDYVALDQLFHRFDETGRSLIQAHKAVFGVTLGENDINRDQRFIVITNGLDFNTRQSIQYWRSRNLDVRPWVYRVYKDPNNELLLEMSRFAVEDNPYEDIVAGYYILNTNYGNGRIDHEDMLKNHKAAAYFSPWKHKIEQLSKGDCVFLYQNGFGIVAYGIVSGKLKKGPYHGDARYEDEEYYVALNKFHRVDPPLSAARIKEITKANYSFRGTMFSLDNESGIALQKHIHAESR